MKKRITYLFLFLILYSCKYNFKINVNPQDAKIFIDNKEIKNNELINTKTSEIKILCKRKGYKDYRTNFQKPTPLGIKNIFIDMEIEKYSIKINTLKGKSDILINSEKIGTTPLVLTFKYGTYEIELQRKNFPVQKCRIEAQSNCSITFWHKKEKISLEQIGVFECGKLPKQIIYSPNDSQIYIPLLEDKGFQIFDTEKLKIVNYIIPPEDSNKLGFPEGLFIKEKNVFWVSQMTTDKIFEYSYPELEYIRTIFTQGKWSKYMSWSNVLQVVAISNWISNDVSIIRYSDGKVVKKIKTGKSPRGLIFTKNGKKLYVCEFGGSKILKINTNDWKIENSIFINNSAMRHIVLTNDEKKAYASDMLQSKIYEIDLIKFEITNSIKVDYNPNTIDITPNNKFLFVSSRGPNSKEGYLHRSQKAGKISIIDLSKKKIIGIIEGGNQPTGLDVSNNGNYLCFSNFQDHNIEIYWIGDLVNARK